MRDFLDGSDEKFGFARFLAKFGQKLAFFENSQKMKSFQRLSYSGYSVFMQGLYACKVTAQLLDYARF